MRPLLDSQTDPDIFLNFYWLKEELSLFCKKNNLHGGGSKADLTLRIYEFLKTGKIPKDSPKTILKQARYSAYNEANITIESLIPKVYRNDEKHRAFFKAEIGEHFRFNVPFMNWMKANAGKTYSDAIVEWKRIYKEKRDGLKTEISPQFEFNQYFRDFFKANPNATRKDALRCWKYKKSIPGNNRYEDSDLSILNMELKPEMSNISLIDG